MFPASSPRSATCLEEMAANIACVLGVGLATIVGQPSQIQLIAC
jgi:hypothetical protein